MFRFLACTLRAAGATSVGRPSATILPALPCLQLKAFAHIAISLPLKSEITPVSYALLGGLSNRGGILSAAIKCVQEQQVRSVTKFSIRKGKRKSLKAAISRFYRLAWGGWIRTRASRFKRLWTKTEDQKRRYRQHVFCNATQCTLLDKMVTKYWKRRKYYPDDPYEPYHSREEFIYTARKPLPLSYHIENNPKLNPKKQNEVLSYFNKNCVHPNLKYKVK